MTSGSATDGADELRREVRRAACEPWRPVTTSRHDVLTDRTADEIAAHNRVYARLCEGAR